MHAESATKTLTRIANFFPADVREQKMYDLSNSLKAIVTQRLLMTKDGKGRIPAFEILSNTPHVKMLISENKVNEVNKAMRRSTLDEGTISFDNFVFDLYESEKISYKEALKYVDSVTDFNVRLRADSKLKLPDILESADLSWDLSDSLYEVSQESKGAFRLS